jgi:hypothetical protein
MRIAAPIFLLTLLFIAFTTHSQVSLKFNSQKPVINRSGVDNPINPKSANRSPERIEKCGFAYLMNQAKAKGFNEQAYESFMRKLIEKRRIPPWPGNCNSARNIPCYIP